MDSVPEASLEDAMAKDGSEYGAVEKSTPRKDTPAAEGDENQNPGQMKASRDIQKHKRRSSDGGGPPTRRLSNGSAPAASQPRQPGQKDSPRIPPRETRSSLLRKSLSGSESTLMRSPSNAAKEASPSTPGAMGSELMRLRDDLMHKDKQISGLDDAVTTLKGSISTKERALTRYKAEVDAAREKLTQTEGELANRIRSIRALETEKNKMQAKIQNLEREADKLHRQLNASPKGTGLSEVVATLEAEVKSLKAENIRLENDSKAVYNQLRAKDKELDGMALEVERAQEFLMQNQAAKKKQQRDCQNGQSVVQVQDLDNYILDLRRQLQEASNERVTLLNVQRQQRAEITQALEAKAAAKAETEDLQQELTLCKTELKAGQEQAAALSKELELKHIELTRVSYVASKAAIGEVHGLKEEGTVPFAQYKGEVMHLKGDNDRIKEKLRLAEKSQLGMQAQIEKLYKQLDACKIKERN